MKFKFRKKKTHYVQISWKSWTWCFFSFKIFHFSGCFLFFAMKESRLHYRIVQDNDRFRHLAIEFGTPKLFNFWHGLYRSNKYVPRQEDFEVYTPERTAVPVPQGKGYYVHTQPISIHCICPCLITLLTREELVARLAGWGWLPLAKLLCAPQIIQTC